MSLSPFSRDSLTLQPDLSQVVKDTLKMRPAREIVGEVRGILPDSFNPGLPYFSTARCREAFETYARVHENDLRTQAITPALWALLGGLFTYTITPGDYTSYRRQRGVRLITYLVLPSKEVPAWIHG